MGDDDGYEDGSYGNWRYIGAGWVVLGLFLAMKGVEMVDDYNGYLMVRALFSI